MKEKGVTSSGRPGREGRGAGGGGGEFWCKYVRFFPGGPSVMSDLLLSLRKIANKLAGDNPPPTPPPPGEPTADTAVTGLTDA